jgi:hypothetical protein
MFDMFQLREKLASIFEWNNYIGYTGRGRIHYLNIYKTERIKFLNRLIMILSNTNVF